MTTELTTFLAEGLRDTVIEAVFASVFTAAIILAAALLSGRWLQRVDVGGINLDFASDEAREAFKARSLPVPGKGRIRKSLKSLRGSWDVLWVDDHPEWNRHEMEALNAVGFSFRIARTNEEAAELLSTHFFNLVISDIGRDDESSGLEMEQITRRFSGDAPIIFYVGQSDGPKTPNGAPVVVAPDALFTTIARLLTKRRG